jgi:hypothetical protein
LNYFNVIEQTKPVAQTANESRVLFDRDDLSSDGCEFRGDYPVSGTNLENRIGWSNRAQPNQAVD